MQEYFANDDNFEKLLAEIWEWKDTPYWRNAAVQGRGADCATFILKVLNNLGIITEFSTLEYLPKDWHINGSQEILLESIELNSNFLTATLEVFYFEPDENLKRGDFLIFSTAGTKICNHAAIYLGLYDRDGNKYVAGTGFETIVHCTERKGVHLDRYERWKAFHKKTVRLLSWD